MPDWTSAETRRQLKMLTIRTSQLINKLSNERKVEKTMRSIGYGTKANIVNINRIKNEMAEVSAEIDLLLTRRLQ